MKQQQDAKTLLYCVASKCSAVDAQQQKHTFRSASVGYVYSDIDNVLKIKKNLIQVSNTNI